MNMQTIEIYFYIYLQIERDFEKKYLELKNKLILSWNLNFEKFYNFLKKDLTKGDQMNEILMQSESMDLGKCVY